jgi:hypothetical protein
VQQEWSNYPTNQDRASIERSMAFGHVFGVQNPAAQPEFKLPFQIWSEHRIAQAVHDGDAPERRIDAPGGRSIVEALKALWCRLALAVMDDWQAAAGENGGGHNKGDVDVGEEVGRLRLPTAAPGA